MSADRALMSVIRTSLSLISCGFTIFQFFQRLTESNVVQGGGAHAARTFGLTLVFLGVGMLVSGLAYHVLFMAELRRQGERMKNEGLIHAETQFPVSLTAIRRDPATACWPARDREHFI